MNARYFLDKSIPALQRMPSWQLWLGIVPLSVVTAEIIVMGMEWLLLGKITADFLLTGLVTSGVVASVAAAALLYLLHFSRRQVSELDAILKAVPDLLFELDQNGKYINVWAQNPELLIAQRNTLLGHAVGEMLPPEAAGIVMSALKEASEKGHSSGQVIRLNLPQGESWFELSVSLKSADAEHNKRFIVMSRDITERKQAEQSISSIASKLRESQQLLEAVVENIPVMVFVKRASDLRFELFNRAGEKLLGYSRNDLLGKGDYDFWPKEQGDWFTAADRKVLESNEITEIPEEPIKIAGGETRYLHTWKIALRDEDGVPRHLLGISIDITERKEAEQVLALYAELVQQMAEGMILIHAGDGVIIVANPAFERMFGYAPGELTGKNVAILNAPTEKSPEETAREINFALRQTGVWSGEIENIKKDGTPFWCLANVSTFDHPQHGEVWLSIHQDITERRRTEEALRRTSEEIEDLYEHAPCGYHSLDENGLIIRMNHTELEWMGYRREEVVGKMRIQDMLTPGSVQSFQEVFPLFKRVGYLHDLEMELRRKDGTVFPVLVNATAIHDASGRYVSSRSTLFDLTERKKLEHELELQARIDMLTGLNNRRHFFELAETQVARAKRYGTPFSLLMLDVDHFKLVNDTYGHHIGDAALQKLSEVCRHTLREIDIIGRIGGEEFAALLPETDDEKALEVAERLRQSVESAAVQLENGSYIHFTISIGISSFHEVDSAIDTMLRRADEALYKAKNAGRNRVCCEEVNMQIIK